MPLPLSCSPPAWSDGGEAEADRLAFINVYRFGGFEEAMMDSPQIHELMVLALRFLGVVAVSAPMLAALLWQHIYLRISDHAARTILYALLFFPLFGAPAAAVLRGGWWWLMPPLVVSFIALVMRIDDAQPEPGWLHPW